MGAGYPFFLSLDFVLLSLVFLDLIFLVFLHFLLYSASYIIL